MFNIVLYKFSKKTGSMAQPSASVPSVTYSCTARESVSVVNPIILIEDPNDALIGYNYAYIADWGKRYYFISDMILVNNHLYELHLSIDVLATYRTDIRNSSQFVMRSASNYNTNLIDTMYDMEGRKQSGAKSFFGTVKSLPAGLLTHSNYFNTDITGGYFIIGVIGDNGTGVTYYGLSYSLFRDVVSNLMSYIPSDMSDVSNGIAKALADPIQYVTSCMWVPVIPTADSTANSIKFGSYTINIGGYAGVFDDSLIQGYYCDVDIPKHPQTATRGGFMNLSPYAYYSLDFQPFGTFMLDSQKMYGCAQIRAMWFCDLSNGVGLMKIYALDTTTNDSIYPLLGKKEVALLATCTTQIGVPIQLTQLTVNGLSFASTLIGGIGSAAAGIASGGVLAPLAGAVMTGIASAGILANPDVSSAGASGSIIAFQSIKPCIYAQFAELTGPDYNRFGRPLEEIATISTLSGYAQTRNATVVYSVLMPTDTEAEMVNSLLDSGVYVE